MKTKTVSYTLDTLPPIRPEDEARLAALFARPDSEIDLTDPDAPELSAEHWQHAVRGKFYRPVKAQVTTKLDADVIAWLKSGGKGYQTRMNAILRRAMLEERRAARKAG
jgi:uncharacterized protein (DUF4415 family)